MNHRCQSSFGFLGMFQSAHTFCTTAIKAEVFPGSQVGHAWEIMEKYSVTQECTSIGVVHMLDYYLVTPEPPSGERSSHQEP